MASLRRRTLLVVAALMLAVVAVVTAVQHLRVYPSFLALEQEQARRNAEMVIELTDSELEALASQPADWGFWDETYRFMTGDNADFEPENLTINGQLSLGVDVLAFYDNRGRKVWARALDLGTGKPYELPQFTGAGISPQHPLLARDDKNKIHVGLVDTDRGPMMIASAPVLTSDYTGPRRGTVFMGRYFDAARIRQIARQTGLGVDLQPHRGPAVAPPKIDPDSLRVIHSPFVQRIDPDYVHLKTVLFTLDGQPSLDLSISTPRDISERGGSSLRSSIVTIAIAGVVIAGLLAWLLNADVLQPLVRITRHAQRITGEDNRDARLGLRREDEIGQLAAEFDLMLDRLQETRQRLFNESYRAGANEMAGGVIQDLRRLLEPLKEHIDQPLKLLDRTHTSGMQLLLQELHSQGASHHRQVEIAQLLQREIDEQADLLAEARGELRGIRKNLERLQGIVTEYSRYVGSSGAQEPVLVAELLDHALRKLSHTQRQVLSVDVDDSVYRAPPVQAVREVLQQVVNVLVEFGAQGRSAEADGHVHLRISAHNEFRDGRSFLCLCFDDNRSDAADASRNLFNRERLAGENESGLNIAWAENAITSMGGRLLAETAPSFQGLQLQLFLPRAKPAAS